MTIGLIIILSLTILTIAAVVFISPRFNRTWGWALTSHVLSFVAAVGVGWFWTQVEGFGFAVGDPPYGTREKEFDPAAIWFYSTLWMVGFLYVLRVSVWLSARMFSVVIRQR